MPHDARAATAERSGDCDENGYTNLGALYKST
jgi:hypothetical protein